MTLDERLSFLPLEPGGESALLIGAPDQRLLELVAQRFPRLTLCNWEPDRLERLAHPLPAGLTVQQQTLVIGSPTFPDESYDLILSFWAVPYLGNPDQWLERLTTNLAPHGRLIIIEAATRSRTPEQELSTEILELALELHARQGSPVQPACDTERLSEIFNGSGLVRIRHRVFTDPDLLVDSNWWRAELERIRRRLDQMAPAADPSSIDRLRRSYRELVEKVAHYAPATPPFAMLTGWKRSPLPSRLTSSPTLSPVAESIGEPAHMNIYVSPAAAQTDPYERLLVNGPGSLKNQELMTLILSSRPNGGFTPDPEQVAGRIIEEYGSKAISEERNPARLAELLGITIITACQVVAVFELGRRFFTEPFDREPVVRCPEDAWQYLRDMGNLKKEHLRGLYLNVQNRLIHDEVISIGTLSRSVVHPREVFAPALEHAANSLILAHNHPSGDLTPSDLDIAITRQLAQAGRIIGIELLDHIIIGSAGFLSLKKKGVI